MLIYFLISIAVLKILKTVLLAVISMGVIIAVLGFEYALVVFLIFLLISKRGLKNLEFGKK